MKIYWLFVIFIFICIVSAAHAGQELSELQRLKAENFKLKSQLLQCQIQVGNTGLTKEQSILVEEFRKTLGAKNEEIFDWNTLTFSIPTKSGK